MILTIDDRSFGGEEKRIEKRLIIEKSELVIPGATKKSASLPSSEFQLIESSTANKDEFRSSLPQFQPAESTAPTSSVPPTAQTNSNLWAVLVGILVAAAGIFWMVFKK